MKTAKNSNPFPWLPWWPEMAESHYVPIVALAIILAAVLVYLAR